MSATKPKASRAAKKPAKKSALRPALEPHAEALRDRILRGAASAFGRLGYTETRVEDIIADTGISRPTFYKMFDSKDAVLNALSERHHDAIRQRFVQAAQSTDQPALQLERALESFLRWRAELGPVGRVLDLEARGPGVRLSKHRKEMLEFVIELSQANLRRAGRDEVDPALLRALVAAAENVADELFSALPVAESTLQRAKAIVFRVHAGAIARPGDRIPPIPLHPQAARSRTRKA